MKGFIASSFVAVFCSTLGAWADTDEIIGYDGKEETGRREPIGPHPRIHRLGRHHLVHMLNQHHRHHTERDPASEFAKAFTNLTGEAHESFNGHKEATVTRARTGICAERHFGAGFYRECAEFMTQACHEGGMLRMTVMKHGSGKNTCDVFFPPDLKGETQAQIVHLLNREAKSRNNAAAPAAAGPSGAPGPAPATAPPMGWPDKMTIEHPLPEQGYTGELVKHKPDNTMTKDWQREFGPHTKGMNDYREICSQYPDSHWCRVNGFHKRKRHGRTAPEAPPPAPPPPAQEEAAPPPPQPVETIPSPPLRKHEREHHRSGAARPHAFGVIALLMACASSALLS